MGVYDVVITGSGSAGLTAGLYTARAKTLNIGKGEVGGGLANIQLIENYPGFSEGVRGTEVAHSMIK